MQLLHQSCLAEAYAELGQFDDAWRCIGEALTTIDTTKERWFEAEVNRVAGEVVRRSPEWDTGKAEAYLNRALAVARQQQAKSGSCAQQPAWRGSGAIRGSGRRPALCSPRSTAGSAKGSIRAI